MEPSDSTLRNQMVEKMNTNDSQRKRQLPEEEGFIQSPKTVRVEKNKISNPVTISNSYETLTGETSEAGPSGVVKSLSPKIRKMPPIAAKMMKIKTSFVNAAEAQTNGQSTFECSASGLRIRPANKEDPASISILLADKDIEFYNYGLNPGQQIKYILRGLPPSIKSEEILAGLREKGIETYHVRQVKRNLMVDGIRTTYFLPVWIITF